MSEPEILSCGKIPLLKGMQSIQDLLSGIRWEISMVRRSGHNETYSLVGAPRKWWHGPGFRKYFLSFLYHLSDMGKYPIKLQNKLYMNFSLGWQSDS